jgi:hypothetical protein
VARALDSTALGDEEGAEDLEGGVCGEGEGALDDDVVVGLGAVAGLAGAGRDDEVALLAADGDRDVLLDEDSAGVPGSEVSLGVAAAHVNLASEIPGQRTLEGLEAKFAAGVEVGVALAKPGGSAAVQLSVVYDRDGAVGVPGVVDGDGGRPGVDGAGKGGSVHVEAVEVVVDELEQAGHLGARVPL